MLDRCLKSGALGPTQNTESPAVFSVFFYQGSTYAVVTESPVMSVAIFSPDNVTLLSACIDRVIFLDVSVS